MPYLHLQSEQTRTDWLQKQQASMSEYLDARESVAPTTLVLYKLFDAYIAAALHGRRGAKVLDIGCGVDRDWPPYVATLRRECGITGNVYAGVDPISHDVEHRSYPFVCARLEELHRLLDDRIDAFLFATSLDHFENLDEVASAVRRLASDNALCIFWVGLHDAVLVGEQSGARAYQRLFCSLSPAAFGWRYLRNVVGMTVTYFRLLRRHRRLRDGCALDNRHFHYFTRSSLEHGLRAFGTQIDSLVIPGTASVFTTVRVDASRGNRDPDAR